MNSTHLKTYSKRHIRRIIKTQTESCLQRVNVEIIKQLHKKNKIAIEKAEKTNFIIPKIEKKISASMNLNLKTISLKELAS